jgi:hypothetical protein
MGVSTNLVDYDISQRNWGLFWQLAEKLAPAINDIPCKHPQDGYAFGKPYYDYSVTEYTWADTVQLLINLQPHAIALRNQHAVIYDGLCRLVARGEGLYSSA